MPIAAVATLRKYNDIARTEVIESLSYNLLPESSSFAWPAGHGSGGTLSGSGLVVLPRLWKDLDASGLTLELTLTNLVPVPGWTDAAILVYDQNDLVDVYCRRLGAGQTTYVNPQAMGAIAPGFRGSALISATYWEHPAPADAAGPARQLVGLGAVAVWRHQTRMGEDIPGDELAGEAGIPLPAWPDPARLPADPCGSAPRSGVAPTMSGHWQSLVPVYADRAGYDTELTVRNAGQGPTEVRLYYKALGDCLRDRICTTDELAPGQSLTVPATACVGPDLGGSVALHSREPLTVTAVTMGPGPGQRSPVAARPGRLPFDLNGDDRVDSDDIAALEAARGTSPGQPGWNPLADLDANATVDDADLAMLRTGLCGADRRPGTPDLPLAPRAATAVQLPVLLYQGDLVGCQVGVSAQNVGQEPAKVMLVSWGPPASGGTCAGPLAIACSGLLGPGGSWHFAAASLPSGAKSGQLFSFSTRPLSELGATVGGDEPAADYLCRRLALQLTATAPPLAPSGRPSTPAPTTVACRWIERPAVAWWRRCAGTAWPIGHRRC